MSQCRYEASVIDRPQKVAGSPNHSFTLALCGNPNVGKSTLFNRLTGLRVQTANFPGTTIEKTTGTMKLDDRTVTVLDLPGMYSLSAATPEEQISADVLMGEAKDVRKPDIALVLADADNLERSLFLISQFSELDIPLIVALNMVDIAEHHGVPCRYRRLNS